MQFPKWKRVSGCLVVILFLLMILLVPLFNRSSQTWHIGGPRYEHKWQIVIDEIRSNWQHWYDMPTMSAHGTSEVPILSVLCGYSYPGNDLNRIRSLRFDYQSSFGFPAATNPDEIKTLVVIFKNDTGSGRSDWLDTLHYVVLDWPTRTVIKKKSIPPIRGERGDLYPWALKPFWKDTSWAYATRTYRDYETCHKEVTDSITAITNPSD